MANCIHCGHPFPEDAAFCIECGRPKAAGSVSAAPISVGAPISKAPPPVAVPGGSRARWWGAGLVGLLMLGTGLRQWLWTPAQPTASPTVTAPAVPAAQPTAPAPPAVDQPTPSSSPTAAEESTPASSPIPAEEFTPSSSPIPASQSATVLYQSEHDLDGDGSPELARVVSLEGVSDPNSTARKQFQVLSPEGHLRYVSEPFEEPFHTDLDDLAESPEGKAGLHVLPGTSEFPRIRLIFAARSGNFVDFRFNGQQFELAEIGD